MIAEPWGIRKRFVAQITVETGAVAAPARRCGVTHLCPHPSRHLWADPHPQAGVGDEQGAVGSVAASVGGGRSSSGR